MSHSEGFSFFRDIPEGFFNSFISIDPMRSPPRRQEHGLYRTERFCGVLVAIGFLPPARSFISEGTSYAERRRDKPRTFTFDFQGAALGATGAMSRGFFAGEGVSLCFAKLVWSFLAATAVKLDDS